MQQKNFIVFIILCVVILFGWAIVQEKLWPRKKKEQATTKQEGPKAKPVTVAQMEQMAPALVAGAVGDGLNPFNPLLLTAHIGAEVRVAAAKVRASRLQLTKEERLRLAARLAPMGIAACPGPYNPLLATVTVGASEARVAPRTIDLSGPESYLQVKLTTRGAGVQRLTLPQFQAANDLGQPEFKEVNGKREDVKFNLIQNDPIRPSFLMFHYPHPGKDPDAEDMAKRSNPDPWLGEKVWEVDPRDVHENDRHEREITFSIKHIPGYEGIEIRKTYTLGPKDYHIGLKLEINDNRNRAKGETLAPFRYQLAGAHNLPVEGDWYSGVIRQPMLGLVTRQGNFWRDLAESQPRITTREGGDRVPLTPGESSIQYAGVATQYFTSLIVVDNKQAPGVKPEDVVEYARPTLESKEQRAQVLAVRPKTITVSLTDKGKRIAEYRLLDSAVRDIEEHHIRKGDYVLVNSYNAFNDPPVAIGVRPGRVPRPALEDITVRVVSNTLFAKQRGKVEHKFLLYNGPLKVSLLGQFSGAKAVNPELVNRYWDTLNLRTLTDYHSPGPMGSFASKIYWTDLIIMFTRLMHWLLYWLHAIVQNYGLAIILLTLIVRGLMFPVSRRQAMLSIKMQELGPQLKKVQEKYKGDPQRRNQEVMKLYRDHGVNPFGSCLTLLLQLPVFMGLYYALQESIHFRLAGFLWMDNLAAPDMLIYWGQNFPIISDPDSMGAGVFCLPMNPFYLGPYFNVLPIIAVVLMLIQQKMMTPPAADEQQMMQQKMFKWMMVIMGLLFYKLPAGLALYFIVSSGWGLLERRLLPKRPTPGAAGPGPGGGGGGGGGPGRGGGGRGGKGRPPGKKESEGAITKVKNWWHEVLEQAKKK